MVKILTPINFFDTNIFRFKLHQIVVGFDERKNLIAQMNLSSEENGKVNIEANSHENFQCSMDPNLREIKSLKRELEGLFI